MIVLHNIHLHLGTKLGNNLQCKFAVILDLVPKGSFYDVLLQIGLSEKSDYVRWLDLVHLLRDGGQA